MIVIENTGILAAVVIPACRDYIGGTFVLEPTPALDLVIASPTIVQWRRSCGTRAPRHRPAACRV
jgi:hypothetical protein